MFRGIIFDMDGVLIDSEAQICEAAIRFFAERGVSVQKEDFIPFVGRGENRYLGGVAEKYGVKLDLEPDKLRLYEIYDEIVEGKLGPLPGVHDFIQRCKELGIKIAVATSADRTKMIINLREIGIPAESFDATVNGSEVEHKKPAPDLFLTAAERIGLPASECLVIEDAPSGIEAGLAAGAKCLGLTTSFEKENLPGAEWYAPNLAEAFFIFDQ